MKKLEIEIPEGYEIDLERSDLSERLVVFKEVKKNYPKDIKQINRNYYIDSFGTIYQGLIPTDDYQTKNRVSTYERAKAILALIQLVEFRDAWNKIDGFEADWADRQAKKYVIWVHSKDLARGHNFLKQETLHFGSSETRDLFFNTFRDLIETAKEFL